MIGLGGAGGYFGGLLVEAGKDVTFVARGDHYRTIREKGLTVRCVRGDFHIEKPELIDSIRKIEDPELVLIFVKTYHTMQVTRELSTVVSDRTAIVTFQTGLENDHQIKQIIPANMVYPGFAFINSSKPEPGLIEQISGPCTLTFGDRSKTPNEVLNKVELLLKEGGIDATLSDDIERDMWVKLVWIATFSGMTSIYRSRVGPILNNKEGCRIFTQCLDEAFAIADAMEISIPDETRKKIYGKIKYYKSEGANAKTSLLLDIENNRRTEIETLQGSLVRYARETGVAAPIMNLIYNIISLYDTKVSDGPAGSL